MYVLTQRTNETVSLVCERKPFHTFLGLAIMKSKGESETRCNAQIYIVYNDMYALHLGTWKENHPSTCHEVAVPVSSNPHPSENQGLNQRQDDA